MAQKTLVYRMAFWHLLNAVYIERIEKQTRQVTGKSYQNVSGNTRNRLIDQLANRPNGVMFPTWDAVWWYGPHAAADVHNYACDAEERLAELDPDGVICV